MNDTHCPAPDELADAVSERILAENLAAYEELAK